MKTPNWNQVAVEDLRDEWRSLLETYQCGDWKHVYSHRLTLWRGDNFHLAVSTPDRSVRRTLMQVMAKLSACGCHLLGRASTRSRRIGVIVVLRGDATNDEIRAAVLEGLAASLKTKGRRQKGKGE
ncbi:MAG: hypothetical protein SGJ19_16890 [Planctomycetia bacterium]|nr:hypothetical protein [Planctomycetia bacterium]